MLPDVIKEDCYVQHLAALSKRLEVRVRRDIKNSQGALLVLKGGLLNQDLAHKIFSHQLMLPIESCVQLPVRLTALELLKHYKNYFSQHPSLAEFHKRRELNLILIKSCHYYQEFPALMQKMTVVMIQLPRLFSQALFCAYVSMAIRQQMKGSDSECVQAFLAGLIHDIGILHLDTSLISQQGEYTPKQWQAMQSHCVLGYEMLMQMDRFPESIAVGVLEHHERYDGSGYPNAKSGDELGILGQILGMADTCLALYKRDLVPKKLGFDALLPVLQLNPGIYCNKVYAATLALIRDIPWPGTRTYTDGLMPEMLSRLILVNQQVNHDYVILYGLVTSIRHHLPRNKNTRMLNNMSERLHLCLLSSGILQSEHRDWMITSCSEQKLEDYLAIERLEIMYNEINWQLRQIRRLLILLWDKRKDRCHPELDLLVKDGLLKIQQFQKGIESS